MNALVVALAIGATGGLESYVRLMSSALRAGGHSVEAWAMFEQPLGLGQVSGDTFRGLAPRGHLANGAHHRLRTARLGQLLAMAQRRPDLVLAMHPMLAPGVRLGTLNGRRPEYAVWTYGMDIWGPWPVSLTRALKSGLFIGTISHYTAAQVTARLPDVRVEVVPPCLSDEWMSAIPRTSLVPSGESGVATLLTVSRITDADWYKGHDVVLRALPAIQDRLGEPVQYRVVGAGKGLVRLRQLAIDAGVEEHVRFLGALPDDEVRREYSNCDLFVMPSRVDSDGRGSCTGEGFGIAYLEAAAAAKPVVGSTEGGAVEAVRHGVTGLAVEPRSAEQVAHACCRILENPSLARQMGLAGRAMVEVEFTEQAFRRRLRGLIDAASG